MPVVVLSQCVIQLAIEYRWAENQIDRCRDLRLISLVIRWWLPATRLARAAEGPGI
jgi:hypothetical protein